jgi:hypothetical protein
MGDILCSVLHDDVFAQLAGCHGGRHRARTAGLHLADLLNAYEFDNVRMHNAMVFVLDRHTANASIDSAIESATRWIDQPWTTTEPCSFSNPTSVYGFAAVQSDFTAFTQWSPILQVFTERANGHNAANADGRVVVAIEDDDMDEAPGHVERPAASASSTPRVVRPPVRAQAALTPIQPSCPPPTPKP